MDKRALARLRRSPADFPQLEVGGPMLVFGGCYSNLEATKAIREQSNRLGIPPERTICTGDVVAYCADPAATVELIREWGIHVVMGNCEEALGWDAGDCGCGFAAGSACDRLSSAWYSYASSQIDESARAWMRALPERVDILIGGRRLAVVHAAVDSINRFVFRSTRWTDKLGQIRASGCDGVVGGHSGLPFTQIAGDALWHNSGSIGLPANDGTSRVWYSLIVPTSRGIEIHTEPLHYDAALAARKMRAAGLPEGYAAALEVGLWPSCDVLPREELAARGEAIPPGNVHWNGELRSWPERISQLPRRSEKFKDPEFCESGEKRAIVNFRGFDTLWFNTGTLCNLACTGCYIESSPKNDALSYISREEVRAFLRQATSFDPRPSVIGFTGGEPFLNPQLPGMIEDALAAGFKVLVLTNAMKPMQRFKNALSDLNMRFPRGLLLRVSLDHYEREKHEQLRGQNTWRPAIDGLLWLAESGFEIAVACRMAWDESELELRNHYRALFRDLRLPIDANNPDQLVLFPEIDPDADVPEISESCWDALGKCPDSIMCASSRMVIKRRGSSQPSVVSCTILPHDRSFELGSTLAEAVRPVSLNHRHCAEFCVLGGASCSKRHQDPRDTVPEKVRDCSED